MARKPRDYAGEYAKRISRGEAKGLTRTEARGHITPRIVKGYTEKHTPKGIDRDEYIAAMDAAIENYGTSESELREQYTKLKKVTAVREMDNSDPNKAKLGMELWESKEDWEPPEMYWYHDAT